MFISCTNENHFQSAQYGCFEYDLLLTHQLKPTPLAIYMAIKDRISLSIKNKEAFSDSQGYFVKFDQTKLAKLLNITKETVIKWMKHLKDIGLICYDQDKQGTANKIRIVAYEIKHKRQIRKREETVVRNDLEQLRAEKEQLISEISKLRMERDSLNQEKISPAEPLHTSSGEKIPLLTSEKNSPEHPGKFLTSLKDSIYLSITKDMKNTIEELISQELSSKIDGLMDKIHNTVNLTVVPPREEPAVAIPMADQYELMCRYYKDLMGYDYLLRERSVKRRDLVDDFFQNIMQMHYCESLTIKGNKYSKNLIRGVLAKISPEQMMEVMNRYASLTVHIIDHSSYIKSMIFNSCNTFHAEIDNRVAHDEHLAHLKRTGQLDNPDQPNQLTSPKRPMPVGWR